VTRPAKLSLLAAMLVVLAVVVGVAGKHAIAKAPVQPEAAGITGEAWVMPGTKVQAFLKAHDAPAVAGTPWATEPVVVGWVSWSARAGSPDDEHFTVLLGDDKGGAGVLQEVPGRSEGEVALGNGSMWSSTVSRTSWLRGSRTLKLGNGVGVTDVGVFASLPTRSGGQVWFVGQVLSIPVDGSEPTAKADARPVLGVALSTGDRVWWVRRVASAHVEGYGG
jgi:hypothetical protein